MFKFSLIPFALLIFISSNNLFAQNIGDWGSISSGKISEINKFKTWNGTSFSNNASGSIPVSANVYILHDINLDQNFSCKNLIVRSNKTSFENQSITINIDGNIEIQASAVFDMSNAGGNRIHQINLKGNISVAAGATFDLSKTSSSTQDVVDITFNDVTKDQFISSSGTLQLNNVTVVKNDISKKVVCNPNPNLLGIITVTTGGWEQFNGQAKFITSSSWTIAEKAAIYIKGSAFISHYYSNTITVSGILSLNSTALSTFSTSALSMNVRDINVSAPSGNFILNSGELLLTKIRIRSTGGIGTGGKISINGGKLTVDYLPGGVTSPGHISLGATIGNIFEMKSGIIHFKKSNPSTGAYSFVIDFAAGSIVDITGGKFIFGDGASTGGILSNGFKVCNRSTSVNCKFPVVELRLNNYSLNMESNFGISDSLILTSGSLNSANYNLLLNGFVHGNGVSIPSTARLEFGGDKTYTLPAVISKLKSLRIAKSGGELISTKLIITDSIFLESGTFNTSSFGFNVLNFFDANLGIIKGSGSLSLPNLIKTANPSGLIGSSNSTISNGFTNLSLPPTGTIEYYAPGSQFISERSDYFNINILGGGTKTMLGDVTINGSLALINADLAIESNVLTLRGAKSGLGVLVGSRESELILAQTGNFGNMELSNVHFEGNYLKNLTVNLADKTLPIPESGSVSLGDNLLLTGTLDLHDGELKTNNKLTLVSDLAGTARISKIIGGTIADSVIAQRFIPASGRRYRMLSSPVNSGNNSIKFSQLIDDIHITGPGGVSNGFDPSTFNNHSSYFYNESVSGYFDYGYVGPANINVSIPTAKGILVMLRGDRNSPALSGNKYYQAPFPAQTAVTMDYKGLINQGTYAASLTYTPSVPPLPESDGYNLIGNPYPSQIDWKSNMWRGVNVDRVLYIFNPATNSYGTYLNNSPSDIGTNGVGRYIASGQAFFVKANGPNPSLTFMEDLKATGTASTVLRNGFNTETIRIKMFLDSVNIDEFLVFVDSTASKEYNANEDGLKFMNTAFNIFSKTQSGKNLSISTVPSLDVNDTLALSVTSTTNKAYKFIFSDFQSINPDLDILLVDNFLNTTTDIRLNNQFSFSTTSDINSKGDNRFKIIFKLSAPLPIKLTSFSGKIISQQSHIKWITSSEINSDWFELQRSTDASNFANIAFIKSKGGLNTITIYDFIDNEPEGGVNYYRLISVDMNGSQDTSKVIALNYSSDKKLSTVRIYPNPADEIVSISLQLNSPTSLVFKIFTSDGKLIRLKKIIKTDENFLLKENIADLPEGIYVFKFEDAILETNLSEIKVIKN